VLGRHRGEERAASDESERGGKDSSEGAVARRQGRRRVTREGPSRGRVGEEDGGRVAWYRGVSHGRIVSIQVTERR
jgi:hypothetical protein